MLKKILNRYFIGALLVIATFSTILNRTALNGFVDRCDGYNYLANGIAFTEMGREFINPHFNIYEDFQKTQKDYKFNQVPYPNKLFSLIATKTTVDSEFLYPARTTWLSVTAVTLGLLVLWLLLIQVSDIQIATISAYFIFLNTGITQYYGRPISDPFAWSLIIASVAVYLSSRTWGRWLSSFILGVAFAFRLQSFFVLISQFIYEIALYRRKLQTKKQMLINIAIAAGVSYITFKLIVHGIEATYYTATTVSKGDFGHYSNWATQSLLNLKFEEMVEFVTGNMKTIFSTFPIVILGSLYLPREHKDDLRICFLRWFAFTGFVLPVLFYSISPGFETRYLIYSIPVMTFLTTLNVVTLLKRFVPRLSEYTVMGVVMLMVAHMAKIAIMTPSMLDSTEVTQYFNTRLPLVTFKTPAENDFILTNKALAGAFFKNFNLVRVPPVKDFLKGDNSNVSAVVIFFDMACSSDPNFSPVDYLKYERLVDDHHNIFVRDFRYENASREIIVYFNKKYLPEN
ncbi:hypothetical protein [Pseudobdellovibrio sp. HCB154]|uniref:hypothetical protein n=1 Tax=Pseudobdellovibrio sp. HCB154 TaxID=3386277 RepID=UPI00391747CD